MNELQIAVHRAVSAVDDPEYPGISIVDLGLLEKLEVTAAGTVKVGLVPTFAGCPALDLIKFDVISAVAEVDGVEHVDFRWLAEPLWDISRVSADARMALAESFTVAVQIGKQAVSCPRCGGATQERSPIGPSRCRAINQCTACREPVEVMRA